VLHPAWVMAIMLISLGVAKVNSQSVEPQVVPSPRVTAAQTGSAGNAANQPANSWDQPIFVGNPNNMGSPYVPIESWIYPAFDRLIALGSVLSAIVAQRL